MSHRNNQNHDGTTTSVSPFLDNDEERRKRETVMAQIEDQTPDSKSEEIFFTKSSLNEGELLYPLD